MSGVSTLTNSLRRFRRAVSPPGRPGRAAVPADRSATLADELAEVFAAIDALADESERIRRDAEDAAAARREQGAREADRILQRAREDAAEDRARAAADRRASIDADIHATLAAGAREAAQIRARARDRAGQLADRITRRLLDAEFAADGEGAA